jgi:hypothetical protein
VIGATCYRRSVADHRDLPGTSGVFKAIVASARKFRRAVTGGDAAPADDVHELGETIGRAFVDERFDDLFAASSERLFERGSRERFEARWRDALVTRGPFTAFAVCDAGPIELAFIPGLEDVPQSQFVAFLEITFASADAAIADARAFAVGAVVLDEGDGARLAALHAR